MIIKTLNTAGTRTKLSSVIHTIIHLTFDILFLQETHLLTDYHMHQIQNLTNTDCFFNHGTINARGVGILMNKNTPNIAIIDHFLIGGEGNGIVLMTEINDVRVNICNLYGPNGVQERKSFFRQVRAILPQDVPTIVGGDLNFVEDEGYDRTGSLVQGVPYHAIGGRDEFREIMEDHDLFDPMRELFNSQIFTVRTQTPNGVTSSRLDRIYFPRQLTGNIIRFHHSAVAVSDHDTFGIELNDLGRIRWGRPPWRCNVQNLKNPELVSLLQDFWHYWQTCKPQYDSNTWWDLGKEGCAEIIKEFSKGVAVGRNREKARLTTDLAALWNKKGRVCRFRIRFWT